MSRVKRGVTAHARHRKVIKQAKGYYGRRKNTIRAAKQAVEKAGQYAYRDRKVRKRTFRALWIQRINAAARVHGPHLWPVHRRPEQGRHRARPQGACRYRRARAGDLPEPGRGRVSCGQGLSFKPAVAETPTAHDSLQLDRLEGELLARHRQGRATSTRWKRCASPRSARRAASPS